MDDDDYRRGRLTNHKVYGEALAILAGDALLNRSFEIILEDMALGGQEAGILSRKARAAGIIAKASGSLGMIGGQVVDLASEGKEIPVQLLEYMHKCKTGALIKAPVLAAGVLCEAAEDELSELEGFSGDLGLAFQIKDDILDIEGSLEKMGKLGGSDAASSKSTYVSIYGLEASKKLLEEITGRALDHLSVFGERADFLRSLALHLVKREN
jgi:geranylgeranyl diphosphate synthase type II